MPRDPEEMLFPSRKERFEDRRKEGEQRKLLDEFFDHRTLIAIRRLMGQGLFDQLDYPISTGKEGGVFRATAGDDFRAVKVYRIGNAVFRRLPPHAIESLRREASASNYQGLVYAWTRREHTILGRLTDARVRVPTPRGHFRNVLVMDFAGRDGLAAPRMQDALIEHPDAVYADLTMQVRRMVVDAHLVHGDLSPYNVLVLDDEPVLIDVAQSIPTEHPQAVELLRRDTGHFARYFQRLGVETTPEAFFALAGGESLLKPAE
jgi:RIO kinase 1